MTSCLSSLHRSDYFADDCLLYRPILSGADRVTMQGTWILYRNGEILGVWGSMQRNVKCVHHQRKVPSHSLYAFMCSRFSSVQEATYLGITLTDELSWSSHVRSIHNRANSTLGFLRKNLRRCPTKVKETVYITLVCSVWTQPTWPTFDQCQIYRSCRKSQRE